MLQLKHFLATGGLDTSPLSMALIVTFRLYPDWDLLLFPCLDLDLNLPFGPRLGVRGRELLCFCHDPVGLLPLFLLLLRYRDPDLRGIIFVA